MARKKLSPAARRAIGAAAKLRWAKYREQKAAGLLPVAKQAGPKRGRKGGRRGRRAGSLAGTAALRAPTQFSGRSIPELVQLRRQIDLELADRVVRESVT